MAASSPVPSTTSRVAPVVSSGRIVRPEFADETQPIDLHGDSAQLQRLQKPRSAEAEKKERINLLAGKLEEAALSGGPKALRRVQTLLQGQDPKEIAQALHRIPTDSVVAQTLVALGAANPSTYVSTLFFLDFYANPSSPTLLRDRALQLINAINVPISSSCQEAIEVRFTALSMIARDCWDNNYQNLRLTAGVYEAEGIEIIATMQGTGEGVGFIIVARAGERLMGEAEKHPGRSHEAYAPTSDLYLRRVEHIDSQGRLVIRDFDQNGDFKLHVFDRQGRLAEEGQVHRPWKGDLESFQMGVTSEGASGSHSTKYFYDETGHKCREEAYDSNGRLNLVLEFNTAGEVVRGILNPLSKNPIISAGSESQ